MVPKLLQMLQCWVCLSWGVQRSRELWTKTVQEDSFNICKWWTWGLNRLVAMMSFFLLFLIKEVDLKIESLHESYPRWWKSPVWHLHPPQAPNLLPAASIYNRRPPNLHPITRMSRPIAPRDNIHHCGGRIASKLSRCCCISGLILA